MERSTIAPINIITPDLLNKLDLLDLDENISEPIFKEKLKLVQDDPNLILIFFNNKHSKGTEVTINSLRNRIGMSPEILPCFYNQDWFIKHDFANITIDSGWYIVDSKVSEKLRAISPDELLNTHESLFVPALLLIYTFFANYLINNTVLWGDNYVWCSDLDNNGDRIYVGNYENFETNKRVGFEIHRHLKLRENYSYSRFM
jgi:hypothetical protein